MANLLDQLINEIAALSDITPEEVTVNLVKKSHINFRPDKRLRKMLQNVEFTHSSL